MFCCNEGTANEEESEIFDDDAEMVAIPEVPDNINFCMEHFCNEQNLVLQTYQFGLMGIEYKGIVVLCHGYASHTIFEWFLPAAPGQPHNVWTGSVVQGLVEAGYLVCAIDHQGHGHSEGARELRCFFEDFDDLPQEIISYISSCILPDPKLQNLPIFALGVSMGGAVAIRIAQLAPDLLRGVVLYSPMLSLESVKKQKIALCVQNKHLVPLAGCIGTLLPTCPIAKPARNTIHPESQLEMDEDSLCYHHDVRARVAQHFSEITDEFMAGGLSEMTTPFATFHSDKDTFTDPLGSQMLLEMADCEDKTYFKIGPGLDINVDVWHALAVEPGREVIFQVALRWIQKRT